MRYIIYGAGGIGSVMGGHLARTGHNVVLIGRPGHVRAINARGLRLITPAGTCVLKIPAVTGPQNIDFTPEDVVFLCVKGQDTATALCDLKAIIPEVPIFCFQNGVRNEETAAATFTRVYGVMVRVGTEYLADGEVTALRDPPGQYIIGRFPAGIDDLVTDVAADLQMAGYLVLTSEDVMPFKWGKLMANLGNALDAITGTDWETARPIYRAVFEEASAIVEKAGIRWISQEQMMREWPDIAKLPHGRPGKMQHSSTWQSLTRRQGSIETEFLNGEIVRVAGRVGMTAPLNEKLVEIATRLAANHEPPGRYSLNELAQMLGLDIKDTNHG